MSALLSPLLEVGDLTVEVRRHHRTFRAVDGVSLSLPDGGSLGIVGESGSGKSLTLRAVMDLLPRAARVRSGTVRVAGQPVAVGGQRSSADRRRHRLAMVFQDALSALDPVMTVGAQVAEAPRRVAGLSARAARELALELLRTVGIPDPARRYASYPHELSGGLRQRIMIAIALSTDPAVLLCDEPTTALDVTIQAQILTLLQDLRDAKGLGIVFVTHDLGSSGRSATRSRSCTRAASWRRARSLRCWPRPGIRIRRRCWPPPSTWTAPARYRGPSPARFPTRSGSAGLPLPAALSARPAGLRRRPGAAAQHRAGRFRAGAEHRMPA